jgi:hypothetical protein
MPDAAHAEAYAVARHYLRAVIAADGLDADPVNQEMRRAPVYFCGRSTRPRLDGGVAAGLASLRVKSPGTMNAVRDHDEQIGVIPASDIYPPLHQTGRPLAV